MRRWCGRVVTAGEEKKALPSSALLLWRRSTMPVRPATAVVARLRLTASAARLWAPTRARHGPGQPASPAARPAPPPPSGPWWGQRGSRFMRRGPICVVRGGLRRDRPSMVFATTTSKDGRQLHGHDGGDDDDAPHAPQRTGPPPTGWMAGLRRKLAPYGALARVEKPIGTWLLLWPGWWAIGMAGPPLGEHLTLLGTFALGAFLMRGAGCTVNDILDKDFDARVERTKSRPLASGVLTRKQAVVFLGAQLTAALGCLLTLNPLSIGVGAASLALVGTYPLMKRITYWPQAFLGLTFNYGAILGWTAATGALDPLVVGPLYASGICWTLIYDTIYAHQDKRDDALIGVKSTALLFGDNTKLWLSAFAACQVAGLTAAGMSAGLAWPYFTSVAMAAAHLVWQIGTVNIHAPTDCARKFVSNTWLGAFIFAGIEIAQLVS